MPTYNGTLDQVEFVFRFEYGDSAPSAADIEAVFVRPMAKFMRDTEAKYGVTLHHDSGFVAYRREGKTSYRMIEITYGINVIRETEAMAIGKDMNKFFRRLLETEGIHVGAIYTNVKVAVEMPHIVV